MTTIKLPNGKESVKTKANEFINFSVLNRSVVRLHENDEYILGILKNSWGVNVNSENTFYINDKYSVNGKIEMNPINTDIKEGSQLRFHEITDSITGEVGAKWVFVEPYENYLTRVDVDYENANSLSKSKSVGLKLVDGRWVEATFLEEGDFYNVVNKVHFVDSVSQRVVLPHANVNGDKITILVSATLSTILDIVDDAPLTNGFVRTIKLNSESNLLLKLDGREDLIASVELVADVKTTHDKVFLFPTT